MSENVTNKENNKRKLLWVANNATRTQCITVIHKYFLQPTNRRSKTQNNIGQS